MKRCSTCQETKTKCEFYKKSSTSDGLHYRCKVCCKVLNRKSSLKKKATKGSELQKYVRHGKNTRMYTQQHTKRPGGEDGDPYISLHELYGRDKGICALCGKEVMPPQASIDHKIPLSRGGEHQWHNVQLVHKQCNLIKGNRHSK